MSDLATWLKRIDLDRYLAVFADNDVDLDLLPKLTDDHFKELGVSLGHRIILLEAAARLASETWTERPSRGLRSREGVAMEAERRQLTVMFVDLVGSTAFSERLDPEDLSAVIRAYQDTCAGIIARYDGHIAKFMGDGILVYFGYPQAHEDDAERALHAGLALIEAVGQLEALPELTLQSRIGIATGLVVVGESIGTGSAHEQTVVGETPNLASRLQALADPDTLVVAERTRHLAGAGFDYRDLGAQRLKGIGEPVSTWQVLTTRKLESRFEARSRTITPLVGRDGEFALLRDRWVQARSGEGQVVLLSGEAGIGKSRLIRALRQSVEPEPQTALYYQCSPYHINSSLYPVIGQLERAAGWSREDTLEHKYDTLNGMLGEPSVDVTALFAALLSLPANDRYPVPPLTAQQQKQRTLDALVEQLLRITSKTPILFILEDAHWIDPTTLELVDLAVGRTASAPMLMLISARPEFQSPWAQYGHVTTLSLNPLNRSQATMLVGKITGDKALPQTVLDRIVGQTDGVPLFVEELVKTVLESGLLDSTGERYTLKAPLPALAIPSTLQDSLLARLDRLAPVKETAQIGAAIGREFTHQLLSAVADRPERELDAHLEQLIEAELIFGRGEPPNARYTFKHALVQHAAYESLLKSKRQTLHIRIAQVLEASFPETEPERLAQHYTEAGLAKYAIPYWHKAGERATQRSANREAIEHLNRGLESIEQLPDSLERDQQELELLTLMGPAIVADRGITVTEVGRIRARAYTLCHKIGNSPHRVPTLQGLRQYHMARAELPKALQIGEKLHRLASQEKDAAGLAEACKSLGSVSFFLGDLPSAREYLERGIAVQRSTGIRDQGVRYSGDATVDCFLYLGLVLWFLGYPDRALVHHDKALSVARESAYPYTLADTMLWRATHFQLCRDARSTLLEAKAMAKLAETHNFTNHHVWARTRMIWAQSKHEASEPDTVEFRQCMDVSLAKGQLLTRPFFLGVLAELEMDMMRIEEGLIVVEEGLDVVRQTNQWLWEAELHRLKGELLLQLSTQHTSEAESCFQTSLKSAIGKNVKSYELRSATSLARLWHNQGKYDEARRLLAPIYGWFTEGFHTADLIDASKLLGKLNRHAE